MPPLHGIEYNKQYPLIVFWLHPSAVRRIII